MKEYMKKYRLLYYRNRYVRYAGVCVCPKCGKKGYEYHQRRINLKTGTEHKILAYIHHQHTENKKTVYENSCYIGTVEK